MSKSWSLKARIKDLTFKLISLKSFWMFIATAMLLLGKLTDWAWISIIGASLGLQHLDKTNFMKNENTNVVGPDNESEVNIKI